MAEQHGRNHCLMAYRRNTNKNQANSPPRTSKKLSTLKASGAMENGSAEMKIRVRQTPESQVTSHLCAAYPFTPHLLLLLHPQKLQFWRTLAKEAQV